PMMVAILGGPPDRFVPFANLYRKSAQDAGHDISKLPLGINTHFYVADTSQQAADEFYPSYEVLMNRIGRERGWSPLDRRYFEQMRAHGPLMVGSVQEIIDKILYQYELFHHTRYLAQFIEGDIPHRNMLHAIELFGTKIAPVIRKELAGR